jgi:hypothetical protein
VSKLFPTKKTIQQKAGFLALASVAGEDTKVLNFQMEGRNTISLFG